MSDRLAGKVALITGGTSGIGAATAQLFAAEGATVVISGRSVEKGSALADELGAAVSFCESDVTQEADIAKAVDFTTAQHGKLDILFNNAGGPVSAPLDQLSQEHIDYGVHLLLSSVILGTRYAIAPMKAAGAAALSTTRALPRYAIARAIHCTPHLKLQ